MNIHKASLKKAVIVLPTYNEKDNIGKLLEAILEQQHKITNFNLHVLVVDDSSPDGTAAIVQEYAKRNSNIHLLIGKKQGLGVAYIKGFQHAIHMLHADIVFEMDADFSHDPNVIPDFLDEIEKGYSFIIGSRYIKGGTIPKDWSFFRKANSKVGNIVARYIAGLKGVKDCTSGYRAIKTDFLKKITLNKLGVKGYAFQMNLLHASIKNGARVSEIPIRFIDRTHGNSKLRKKDILEFILNALFLRFSFLPLLIQFLSFFILGFALGMLLIFLALNELLTPRTLIIVFTILFSTVMTFQSAFSLFWMLYAWEDAEKAENNKTPEVYSEPKYSFSAVIPARHEQHVIADTIDAISNIHYPRALMETLIVCRSDDEETIAKTQETIHRLNSNNVKLIIFDDAPINKPHSLNVGLSYAKNDIVVIFDAEDQPSTDIYNIANTVMIRNSLDVLQSGVQLMNFRSSWFSALNVLEYFFWFKSTLHFFAKMRIIPLGGNTVFFKKKVLQKIGGWDEKCLTEDADVGIRLSVDGAKVGVVYDERHTTKEETPTNVHSFIRQRTRWNQGFIQILKKGEWLQLKTTSQKLLAGYILLLPQMQAVFFLLTPISILSALVLKLPIIVTMFSIIPVSLLILQLVTYNIGLYEFTKSYKLKYSFLIPLKILYSFYPFQIILGVSALRAITRIVNKKDSWEKTLHINAHRQAMYSIAPSIQFTGTLDKSQ